MSAQLLPMRLVSALEYARKFHRRAELLPGSYLNSAAAAGRKRMLLLSSNNSSGSGAHVPIGHGTLRHAPPMHLAAERKSILRASVPASVVRPPTHRGPGSSSEAFCRAR